NRAATTRCVDHARTVGKPRQAADDVSVVSNLPRLSPASRDDKNIEPQAVAPLESNPPSIGRPTRIEVIARSGFGEQMTPGSVERCRDQLDLPIRQAETRQTPCAAYVGRANAVDQTSGRAAEGRNTPHGSLRLPRGCR